MLPDDVEEEIPSPKAEVLRLEGSGDGDIDDDDDDDKGSYLSGESSFTEETDRDPFDSEGGARNIETG